MDIHSVARKQRSAHPTRAQVNSRNNQIHSPMPPHLSGFEQQKIQSREQLLRKNQPQQYQNLSTSSTVIPPVLTLHDISQKHSQPPPHYRQMTLETQQREYQLQALKHQFTSISRPPLRDHSDDSPTSSTTCSNIYSLWRTTPPHQRATLSASMPRSEKEKKDTAAGSGPSRDHWKPDASTHICTWPGCTREFGLFDRRHHCRRCGDIFCRVHSGKSIPLNRSINFSPSEGVSSRACNACFEAFEQWQQNLTSKTRGTYHNVNSFGFVSSVGEAGSCVFDSHRPLTPSGHINNGVKKNSGSIPDGFLSPKNVLGREDVVYKSYHNTAIKTRTSDEPLLPMSSVPHDWSWSTF